MNKFCIDLIGYIKLTGTQATNGVSQISILGSSGWIRMVGQGW